MVKEIAREIEIPEGVDIAIDGYKVTVKGPKGQVSKRLYYPYIEIKKVDSNITVNSRLDRKQQRAMVGTIEAHIKNMIVGVTKGYEYRMKAVYSHFPIQIKANPKEVAINNFLGERNARSAKILDGVKVEINKDELVITGINKENVGQTMANIEQATRVRGFDIRVFQDGVYLVEKR